MIGNSKGMNVAYRSISFSHFSMAGHGGLFNNLSIIFIKTDPFGTLRREDYWRQIPKPMAQYELNNEENV